jgi:hypothetical protein
MLGYYIALCTSAHFENAQKSTSKFSIKSEKRGNIPKQIIIGSRPGMTSFSFKSARSSKPSVSVKSTQIKSVATSRAHIFKHEPNKQQFSRGYSQQNIQQRPPQQYIPPPPPQQYIPTPPPQQYIPPPPQQNIPQPPPNRNIPMPPPNKFQPPLPPPNKFQPPLPPPNEGSGFLYQTVVSSHNPINAQKFVFTATTYQAYPQGNANSDLHGYAVKSKRHNKTNNNSVVEGNSRIVEHNTMHSMPSDAALFNLNESSGKSVMRANKIATQTFVKENNNAQSKMFYFRIPISKGIDKTNASSSKSSSQATLNTIQNDRENKSFEGPSAVYRSIVSDHLDALFAEMPIFRFSASTNNYTIRNRNVSKTHTVNHVNTLQNIVRLDVLPELKSNRFVGKVSDRSDGNRHGHRTPVLNESGSRRSYELFRANINMSDVRFKLTTNHTERKKNLRNTQRIHALSGIISKQHHVSNFNNKEYVSKNDITKPQKILGNHNKAASTYVLSIPIGQNKNSSNYVPIVTNNELPINQRDKAQQFMNTEHKPKATYVLTYPLEKKNISSRMSNLTETRHPSVEPKKNISSRMSNLTETRHPSVELKKNISSRMSNLAETRHPSVEPMKNISSRMSNLTETRHPSVEPKKNISSRMSNLTETRHPSVEPKKNISSRMSNLTETRHPSVEPKKNISSRMSSLAETRHPSVEPKHSVLVDYTMNQTIKASNSKTMKNVSNDISTIDTKLSNVSDFDVYMPNDTVDRLTLLKTQHNSIYNIQLPPITPFDDKLKSKTLSDIQFHGITTIGVKPPIVASILNKRVRQTTIYDLEIPMTNAAFDVTIPAHTAPGLTMPPATASDITIPTVTASDIIMPAFLASDVSIPSSNVTKSVHTRSDVTIPVYTASDVTIPVHTAYDVAIPVHAASDLTIPAFPASVVITPAAKVYDVTIPAAHTATDVTPLAATASNVTKPIYTTSDVTIQAFPVSDATKPVHKASDVTLLVHTAAGVTIPVVTAHAQNTPIVAVPDVITIADTASDKIHLNAKLSVIPTKSRTTEFRNPSNRVDDFQIFNTNEILTHNNTVKQSNDLLIEQKLTNKNVMKHRNSAIQTPNTFVDDTMLHNDVMAPTIDVISHQTKPLDSIDHPSENTIMTSPQYNEFIPNADVLSYFEPGLITGFDSKDNK